MTPRFNYDQFRREERRLANQARLQEEADRPRIQEELMSKTFKTALGDMVPKWPSVAGRDEKIAEVQQALNELFDAAVAERKRRKVMDAQSSDLGQRFPVVGDQ
jgi:MoxR-like ATPase